MSSRLIKRLISKVLIITLILCLNNFAAVVTDDDGSAFITKAEFDSLKNSFQAQIDSYNQAIDSKIDGAIAAYLSGIRISTEITDNIYNNSWEKVTFMNGVVAPTFVEPDFNGCYAWGTCGWTQSVSSQWKDGFNNDSGNLGINYSTGVSNWTNGFSDNTMGRMALNYSRADGDFGGNIRPLVTITGSEAAVGDLIWDGIATNAREKWTLFRTGFSGDHWNWWNNVEGDQFGNRLVDSTRITFDGYLPDVQEGEKSAWSIKLQYTLRAAGETERRAWMNKTFADDKVVDCKIASMTLEEDADGNIRKYDHVVNYDDHRKWCLSNSQLTKTFRNNSVSNIKASNLLAKTTKNFVGELCVFQAQSRPQLWWSNKMLSGDCYTETDSIISSVGMLHDDYKPSQIYQDSISSSIYAHKNFVIKPRPTMRDGFQLLAAAKDDIINWRPKFSRVYAKNASGVYAENQNEVDIYLSYEPFGEGLSTSAPILLDNGADHMTTTGRECMIKFKLDQDALVYMKVVPHYSGTSYINDDWEIDLNVAECNSYKYSN